MNDVKDKAVEIDWRTISKSKDSRELDTVTGEMLERESTTFVQTVRQLVDTELYVIATAAQKTADAFWEVHHEVRESGDPKEQGYFGTRARIVDNSLDAHWVKNTIISQGNGKKRVQSDHLKREDPVTRKVGIRYPASVFKSAKRWEKEMIKVTEDRYVLLRQRSQALSKIRSALAEYDRLVQKCYRE